MSDGRLVHRFLDLTVPFECPTEQELSEDLTNLSGLRSVLEGYLDASERMAREIREGIQSG